MWGNVPVVGLFDSGIGGLNVLNACVKTLSGVCFLYLGDNGNAPYGNLSSERIYSLVKKGVKTLVTEGADVVVLACNTATAVCVESLRKEFSIPIVGTEPALSLAAKNGKDILVLATERTVKSERVKRLVLRYPDIKFTLVSCPTLAGEIERGKGKISDEKLHQTLPKTDCDGVVLGCTHYPMIASQISAYYNAPTYDGCEGVARRVKQLIFPKIKEKQGELTTMEGILGIVDHQEKPNKSLHIFVENVMFQHKNVIYFLEKWQKSNKSTYEHMFSLQKT